MREYTYPTPGDEELCELVKCKYHNLITDAVFFYWHAKAPKARWKIISSGEVSRVALMIYPRILGAGQNAQNIDFPKSAPHKNQSDN